MSIYRAARNGLAQAVKSRLGRQVPERLGMRRFRPLLDDYEVADLIEVDGKIPLNYFTYRPNFGDLLSPWLVQKMTGREVVVADRKKPHYVVIGSIINQGTDRSIFWGTGTYGTEGKNEVAAKARYTAVRGPLTRAKLSADWGFGIRVPETYGDPALLAPLYYQPKVPITHEYGVVVRWSERKWARATYGQGVKLIDFARDDVEEVIRDLMSCRRIITSSLHGLIVADAYGIPNAWLASESPRGGVYKFYDYFASVDKFRQPQKFDPAAAPVTKERLRDAITFSGEAIRYDCRPLLDASPFLRRKERTRPHFGGKLPSRESGTALRSQPGQGTFFQSLGFFGGNAVNYLPVRVEHPISQIRLFLPKSQEGELDLRGLEIYERGRRVVVDEAKLTFDQSSDAMASGHRRSPFALGGIRTESEVGPWWTVTFDAPVQADEIRVFNRLDGYGVRSRKLTVAVAGPDGQFRTVRSVDSDRVIETSLALFSRLTGQQVNGADLMTKASARAARTRILAELARRSREGLLTSDREEQRLLASMIRRHRLPAGKSLSDDEWTLLGHLLAAERLRVPATRTSMRAFHLVLDSREKLARLEREVNRAGELFGSAQAVLTRHGFTDSGGLRENSDAHVALIKKASAVLSECGYPAMLAYGTLLGAVREGDFLAHDDDIDMLIPVDAATRDEVEPVLAELAAQLREKGWRFSRPNSYTNFHMTDPSSGLHVDVFPLLVDGDRSSLHMEKMKLRDISTDVVLPPRPFTFLGAEVLAPANPEAFLAERYGETWRTPDPFHDWPWKLHD